MSTTFTRNDGRAPDEIRLMSLTLGTTPYAHGSSEVSIGATRLLTSVSLSPLQKDATSPPEITVSISMLPRSTHLRISEPLIAKAIQSELDSVQKLVRRAIQASVSESILDEVTINVDCHIVCSDAGIATAAVAGSWSAISEAIQRGAGKGELPADASIEPIAALSIGYCSDRWLFDISADEASNADFVATLVVDESGRIAEIKANSIIEPVEPAALLGVCQQATGQMKDIFARMK